MKLLSLALLLLFNFASAESIDLKIEKRTLFKQSKKYYMEGRFKTDSKKSFFVINNNSSNEQFLLLKDSSEKFFNEGKFRVCLQVLKDCYLECTIAKVSNVEVIGPIEEMKTYVPNYNGDLTFKPDNEEFCK